ncbi:hypothetical protein ACPOL_2430 [Acidisarcina polymorpha]|uniref:Uncharacterized protein n=1 Tax=Acidisarcina polymorpha TaxID=2211140 RepID=A0A2Z5FY67_9BACT|nr:hypothetical protein ACPOL_2430 [Acidisarcina polymorpha]
MINALTSENQRVRLSTLEQCPELPPRDRSKPMLEGLLSIVNASPLP